MTCRCLCEIFVCTQLRVKVQKTAQPSVVMISNPGKALVTLSVHLSSSGPHHRVREWDFPHILPFALHVLLALQWEGEHRARDSGWNSQVLRVLLRFPSSSHLSPHLDQDENSGLSPA